ncbi:MAG: homoserine kinase [Elusimicrobiota bacterium]
MKPLARVSVSVPASTSNLGPGFDCLGLALDLRNELTLELIDGHGPALVMIQGEGEGTLPRGESNMMVRAARQVLPRRLPGRLLFKSVNRIPLARGLGSSAAATVAGLWAGAHLFGTLRKSEDELQDLAVKLEGHPDNVAACVHGGLTASLTATGRPRAHRLELHPSLSAVVCIPAFKLSTKKARAALPSKVPLADAVFNISRAILLICALETGRTQRLCDLMADRLHQPYRAKLVPGLASALAAAVKAGAAGAALSGSGPSVFAFVTGDSARRVGTAMQRAFAKSRVASHWLALDIDHQGARIERSK